MQLDTITGLESYNHRRKRMILEGAGLNWARAGIITKFTIWLQNDEIPEIDIRLYHNTSLTDRDILLEKEEGKLDAFYVAHQPGDYQLVIIVDDYCLPIFNVKVVENPNFNHDIIMTTEILFKRVQQLDQDHHQALACCQQINLQAEDLRARNKRYRILLRALGHQLSDEASVSSTEDESSDDDD